MDTHLQTTRQWNRYILNANWVFIFLSVFTEVVCQFNVPRLDWTSWIQLVLVPTSILVVLAVLSEWGVYKLKIADYYILGLMVTSTFVITMVFWFVSGIQFFMILPIIVSVIYFQKSKIIFVYLYVLVAFSVIYYFHAGLRSMIDFPAAITTLMFYTVCAILSYSLMGHGLELLHNLRSSMEDRQSLLVDNVIKDRMMKIDGLTQLYNRRSFQEYLETLIAEADKGKFVFALGLFDVDNFKSINDNYGHWVGDIVLQRVAACMTASVGPNDFVCRYGGEEFAVLYIMEGSNDLAKSMELLRSCIANSTIEELGNRHITVSAGAVIYRRNQGIEQLIREADALLYKAKRDGKNKVVVNETG